LIWKFFIGSTAFLLGLGMGAVRADGPADPADQIRLEIGSAFPGAKIELIGPIRWTRGESPTTVSQVRYLGENGRGEAQIQVRGVVEDQDVATIATAEGMVPFVANVPAYVASRRVMPGEKIDAGYFMIKPVDVSRGQGRELRGVIFPAGEPLAGLESRQTILEGQFITLSAVQKAPDLRRGDVVNIRILSGDLTVNVQGTAEEPGYLDGRVRVMSAKTKRELVGLLRPGSVVEVQL
jgi:flagella basal body P-ring formation protein FlgA